jgi:hypothetical protein
MAANDDAHIPASLRDPVLVLTSEPAYTGELPTVFVGIVDGDYTEEIWNCHADRLASLFNITNPNVILQIKIRNRGNNTIDGVQLGRDMTAAIEKINGNPVDAIRIVGMGLHSAIAVHQALESLVRGWNVPCDQKKVQFVALGDSAQSDYLNLCKSFCLKKLCSTLQFYTTMDYNDFGFLDLDRSKLGNMTPENLERLLSGLKQQKPTGSKK